MVLVPVALERLQRHVDDEAGVDHQVQEEQPCGRFDENM